MAGRLRRYAQGVFRVVATGTWVYDQAVPVTVRLVESDRDFWFDIAEADGKLEDDEKPLLSEDGLCYYVCFREGWEPGKPFWPDSIGFLSFDEARDEAEARVPSAIAWESS
jgi:hypothetical protein